MDFPERDEDLATCSIAFFCLRGAKASKQGFTPKLQVSSEMADVVTKLRVLAGPWNEKEAKVTWRALRQELLRQGLPLEQIKLGITFTQFSALVQGLTRSFGESQLYKVWENVDEADKLLVAEYSTLSRTAKTWIFEFQTALKRSKPQSNRGNELEPIKAVEALELLNQMKGHLFTRGAIDGVQMEMAKLSGTKQRAINAAEFNIFCLRASDEDTRKSEKVTAYLKFCTEAKLAVDPQKPKEEGCVCVVM